MYPAQFKAIIKPSGVDGQVMFIGSGAPNVPVVEKDKPFYVTPLYISLSFLFPEHRLEYYPVPTDEVILATMFMGLHDQTYSNNSIDIENNLIRIKHHQTEGSPPHTIFSYAGELYKIGRSRIRFPEDINPNEPFKTDHKTHLEITMFDESKLQRILKQCLGLRFH